MDNYGRKKTLPPDIILFLYESKYFHLNRKQAKFDTYYITDRKRLKIVYLFFSLDSHSNFKLKQCTFLICSRDYCVLLYYISENGATSVYVSVCTKSFFLFSCFLFSLDINHCVAENEEKAGISKLCFCLSHFLPKGEFVVVFSLPLLCL